MPDARAAEILDRLRDGGGRITHARKLVVEVLVGGASHHVTAPEVVEAVRAVDPDFHESTVYRTLDRLAELGVVTRIEVAGGTAVFHLPEQAHHHLVCEGCGAIIGADPELLAAVAARLRAEHGFVLRAEAVTLPGRCAACVGLSGAAPADHDHPH
ncbi:transcriptional repressor [Aquihabitans sp. G128]|uniref:Fur family transcriptional regulator n=1 Tax=Aquihabitans sp. G128 TaxID=2849779 RepID=UPI001C242D0B|nr:Fur family transcriptional regulator [Aquihabitans sp. G128]QXC63088.1 transcriptional repressor [Aquihabitans sp. G128]